MSGTNLDPKRGGLLMLAALGVVYGDIGTSPLYALKECFNGSYALELTTFNVLGVLSLVFWSMSVVISAKYVTLILRADNKGEGGVMALMALATRGMQRAKGGRMWLTLLGMFGAALFMSDGIITPAISVLSAVEGLQVVTPVFTPYVVPIALVILVLLFMVQRRGTERVAKLYWPIMIVWFTVLALLGISQIVQTPEVLLALSPHHALRFAFEHGWYTFFILGAVFLVMTGGESLYADLGHFGRAPIRNAWFFIVMPSILLNYFGQGALLLSAPEARANPFYMMAPDALTLPLVVLATMASVIASQAVISGIFSVARQAMQLGLIPRMGIKHTCEHTMGQIYVPAVNWTMLICVVALVLSFRSSSHIAAAYGVAVSLISVLEIVLVLIVARRIWQWSPRALVALSLFAFFDVVYFIANMLKVPDGGWLPMALALVLLSLMTTWRQGRKLINEKIQQQLMPMDLFLMSVPSIQRVQGTAVFLTRAPDGIPHTLLHNLKHNKVLHERVVLLSVMIDEVPRVPREQSLEIVDLGEGLCRVVAHFGFVENVSVPVVLERCSSSGMDFDVMDTTFFLGRETLVPSKDPGMSGWREVVFVWMWKNASGAMEFLQLPPNRVVELGAQIEI